MTYAPFCAVCTSEVGPFMREPFGRGGALVNVCEACREVHPVSGRYSFGGSPSDRRNAEHIGRAHRVNRSHTRVK